MSMKQDVDCFADAVEDLINNPEESGKMAFMQGTNLENVYNWDTREIMQVLFSDQEEKSHEIKWLRLY